MNRHMQVSRHALIHAGNDNDRSFGVERTRRLTEWNEPNLATKEVSREKVMHRSIGRYDTASAVQMMVTQSISC